MVGYVILALLMDHRTPGWSLHLLYVLLNERMCSFTGADVGGGCRGLPPPPKMNCVFLISTVKFASQLYIKSAVSMVCTGLEKSLKKHHVFESP